jgi:putative protein-disulfide isomerase
MLIYVGDPMCSWCYGFAPQLDGLLDRFRDRIGCEVLVGGLRPYTASVMDESMKATLHHHWNEVEKRSGQPFRFELLARNDFVYDTEPASRAVTAARTLDAGLALPLFAALQAAFYRDNRDVTQAATLADIASELGLDRNTFLERWSSDEVKCATRVEFLAAREFGVSGFPSLLLKRGDRLDVLCRGYAEAGPLAATLSRALESAG